jgi:hypothetical protein
MMNYNWGKTNKIERISDNMFFIYVGSTVEPTLSRRLAKHKTTAKAHPNRRVYKSISSISLLSR